MIAETMKIAVTHHARQRWQLYLHAAGELCRRGAAADVHGFRRQGDHDGQPAHTKLRAMFYLLGRGMHLEAYEVICEDGFWTAVHPDYQENIEAIDYDIAGGACTPHEITWAGVPRFYILVAFPFTA